MAVPVASMLRFALNISNRTLFMNILHFHDIFFVVCLFSVYFLFILCLFSVFDC